MRKLVSNIPDILMWVGSSPVQIGKNESAGIEGEIIKWNKILNRKHSFQPADLESKIYQTEESTYKKINIRSALAICADVPGNLCQMIKNIKSAALKKNVLPMKPQGLTYIFFKSCVSFFYYYGFRTSKINLYLNKIRFGID
jgi:hypothetical protein